VRFPDIRDICHLRRVWKIEAVFEDDPITVELLNFNSKNRVTTMKHQSNRKAAFKILPVPIEVPTLAIPSFEPILTPDQAKPLQVKRSTVYEFTRRRSNGREPKRLRFRDLRWGGAMILQFIRHPR
jgi:hypothetical protein